MVPGSASKKVSSGGQGSRFNVFRDHGEDNDLGLYGGMRDDGLVVSVVDRVQAPQGLTVTRRAHDNEASSSMGVKGKLHVSQQRVVVGLMKLKVLALVLSKEINVINVKAIQEDVGVIKDNKSVSGSHTIMVIKDERIDGVAPRKSGGKITHGSYKEGRKGMKLTKPPYAHLPNRLIL
ncbi:hypothetical protein V6N13_130730 [Hibiscus sabdariffa]|uniref:Uncharacterized protein n=1 Tax=Hibiscus sabdariffa TaxID=183260 RepID=A0ABR2BP93_9ROSI